MKTWWKMNYIKIKIPDGFVRKRKTRIEKEQFSTSARLYSPQIDHIFITRTKLEWMTFSFECTCPNARHDWPVVDKIPKHV